METRIQLKHPAGKKAIHMDSDKYQAIKNWILVHLAKNGEVTHTEMLESIIKDFKKKKPAFQGSVAWNMEWVKLDLEARKEIKRNELADHTTYSLVKK
jgi:hypothetical protein